MGYNFTPRAYSPSEFRSLIFILFAILWVGGCKNEIGGKVDYAPGLVEKTSKEFLIPRDLRESIENDYLAYIRKENIKNVLPDTEILSRIPREFLDIDLFFRSSAPGVLTDHTRFSLPRGGGEIDLKNCVKGKKGSFYLNYQVKRTHDPNVKPKSLHVYFLSEVRPRKIGGELFGAGCYKYMDITKVMEHANEGEGLQLNATDHRYLPVISGVLYFVDFDPERKIYLAAVRVVDSRYGDEQCAEPIN